MHKLRLGRGAFEAAVRSIVVYYARRCLQAFLHHSYVSRSGPDGDVVGVQRMLNTIDTRQLCREVCHGNVKEKRGQHSALWCASRVPISNGSYSVSCRRIKAKRSVKKCLI